MLIPFRARVGRLGDLLILFAVVGVLFGPIIYSFGRYQGKRAEGVRPDAYRGPTVLGHLCGVGTPADPFRVCEPMTISEATAWATELTGHLMRCEGEGAYQCITLEQFPVEIIVVCREGSCRWASNPALEHRAD